MDTLFQLQTVYPPGFDYYPDFISPEQERELAAVISKFHLHTFMFHGYEAKRKVASFGYNYSFENKSLSASATIPAEFHWIIEKVADKIAITKEKFAELLITEYPAGSVINWHRDAFPFDVIAGISLLSDCVFRLRPHEKRKQSRNATIPIRIRRRSLYVIRDSARSDWQHSISPVNSLRYSITLRTLR